VRSSRVVDTSNSMPGPPVGGRDHVHREAWARRSRSRCSIRRGTRGQAGFRRGAVLVLDETADVTSSRADVEPAIADVIVMAECFYRRLAPIWEAR
jgi:hypothetical protein